MSYSIYLVDTEKSILVEDVAKIIPELPTELRGLYVEQPWGWPLATDLKIDHVGGHNFLEISGSFSVSGGIAPQMAFNLINLLQMLGYNIGVWSHEFGVETGDADSFFREC